MVKSNRKNAYQEAYTILQELNEEEYSKIPPEVIQALKENRNEEYNYEVDEDQELKYQPMLPETKAVLFNIFRDYLATSEQKTILAVEHRGKLPAMIMMYAGLRRGELLALTWDDIDLVNRTITVNKTAEIITNQIRIKDGAKTKNSVRVVNIPFALAEYLKICKEKAKSNIVCCSAKGAYMSLTSWRRLWQSYIFALQEVNPRIPDFTAHWLRHTYATILYHAGVDVLTAKELLGHSKIQTTLDIYTHLDSQFKNKNIDKLNSFLDGQG